MISNENTHTLNRKLLYYIVNNQPRREQQCKHNIEKENVLGRKNLHSISYNNKPSKGNTSSDEWSSITKYLFYNDYFLLKRIDL
jgi:hypothetical protein